MPIIKSAIKRVKQDAKRRARNRYEKDQLRALNRDFLAAVENNDKKTIDESLRKIQSQIDTMAKKNILHKNTAARKTAGFNKKAKAAASTKKK